jgi:hypothetical protein
MICAPLPCPSCGKRPLVSKDGLRIECVGCEKAEEVSSMNPCVYGTNRDLVLAMWNGRIAPEPPPQPEITTAKEHGDA